MGRIDDSEPSERGETEASGDTPAGTSSFDALLRAAARDLVGAPDGDRPPATQALAPGLVVGRYEVRSLLGAGGMGEVYRAHDRGLDREVALKILPREWAGSTDRLRRFQREALALASLSHPNILSVYDAGEIDGAPYLVFELLEGETLRDRLERGGALTVSEAVRVITDVVQGLCAAHEKGIIHRDLKPENVFLCADGHTQILDFGLAKLTHLEAAGSEQMRTRTGLVLGTPGYMSPEQVRGERVDGRSDLFAVGAILYEATSGTAPFRRPTAVQTMNAILSAEPSAAAFAAMPRSVARIARRCLAKAPEGRYPSAEEPLEALRALPSFEGWRPSRARRTLARCGRPAAVVTAAVLVVLAAWLLWTAARDQPVAHGPRAITDHGPPASPVPAARQAYARALQAIRTGGQRTAIEGLQEAVRLDPDFAAAWMRLTFYEVPDEPTVARNRFRRARERRHLLSDREQAILWALEPYILQQPADTASFVARLSNLERRYPGDAEISYMLGVALSDRGLLDRSLGAFDRAIRSDARYARAWRCKAEIEAYQGNTAEALRASAACLSASPGTTSCFWPRMWIHEYGGDCAALEADARRVIAGDPGSDFGYFMLAEALVGQGRTLETAREAIEQALARVRTRRTRAAAQWFGALEVLGGDFAAARRRARSRLAEVRAEADRNVRAEPAKRLLAILLETGRSREAGQLAEEIGRRLAVWTPPARYDDYAVALAPEPLLWDARLRAGLTTAAELESVRRRWIEERRSHLTPWHDGFLWLHGYAKIASTAVQATAALAIRPATISPLAPRTFKDGYLGRTLLLAGRVKEALPLLRRASASCLALRFPFEHTRAQYDLGRALEGAGDEKGACHAYARVLSRWGRAGSGSVTGTNAKARVAALRCARP